MIGKFIRSFLPAIMVLLQVNFAFAQASAVLLPNGEQQFFDNNGNPLAGGSVTFYAPNTTTYQTTWQNANQSIVNTNPIILDGTGRSIIYGIGTYRQVVKDALGNLVWDQPTSTGTGSSSVTNFGDGNAVGTIKMWAGIIAPAQYQFAAGQQILRSSFPDLLSAITQIESVICTSGSNILTAINDTTQISIGTAVEVSCVPGTSIVTASTNSTVTLSNVATTSSAVNATFFPFGNGNGSTTFNIPDLRGYVIAGRDNMGGTAAGRLTSTFYTNNPDSLGASGGAQSTTLTVAEMAGHTHTAVVTDPGHFHDLGTTETANSGSSFASFAPSASASVQTQTALTGISVTNSSTGGGVSQTASLNTFGGVPESTAIASGGSGYTNGSRVLTVSGGTCSIQPAFNVTVAGNAVTQINSVNAAGNCSAYPANPASTTGGGGTGATLNVAFFGTGAIVAAVVNEGSGYTNGTQTLTVLGGTCPIQPTVTALVSGNTVVAISSVVNPGTPYYCTVAPSNPVSLSDGSNTNATANIPFVVGGANYTSGTRIFTVEGGTCTVQPQFSATVTNNQIVAVGSQVTASNCSVAPSNPALIQDAGGVAASATINAGGSGYINGSITLTVLGGSCTTQPSFNATVVSGTVTAINSLANAGSCVITPSSPAATNGGGGVGATLNVTYTIVGIGASFNVIYSSEPFSNIQPTLTLNYVIKVLPDTSLSTSNAVFTVSNADGSLSIAPTNGNVIASINLSHTNSWASVQNFTSAIITNPNLGTSPPLVTSLTWGAINGTIIVNSQPTYTFPENLGTEFQGDFSHVYTAESYTVNGTSMGQPSTGFQWSPAVTPHQSLTNYNSGWNQDTADNGGRTGFATYRTMITHTGQGDAMPYYGFCQVSSSKAGATNFLASPACEWGAADLGATVSGAYLEGLGDFNFSDSGHSISAIGTVFNFSRTTNDATSGLNPIWFGHYVNSFGTVNMDVGFLARGPILVGIDLTQTTGSTAAVNLSAGQKIVLNSTATAIGGINWYGNTIGTSYIAYDNSNSGIGFWAGGSEKFLIESSQVAVLGFMNMLAGANVGGTLGLTPATWIDTQTCTAGQISIDASFIYVCTATNTVKRAALSTF